MHCGICEMGLLSIAISTYGQLLTFIIWSSMVLFQDYFSLSGEQPEQRILVHKSEQPTASCIAIFHKYWWYIKHGGIITNLNPWNPWGMLLICQNATVQVCGARIRIYYVLCSKTYSTFGGLFWSPAGSGQAARGDRICETHLLFWDMFANVPQNAYWLVIEIIVNFLHFPFSPNTTKFGWS